MASHRCQRKNPHVLDGIGSYGTSEIDGTSKLTFKIGLERDPKSRDKDKRMERDLESYGAKVMQDKDKTDSNTEIYKLAVTTRREVVEEPLGFDGLFPKTIIIDKPGPMNSFSHSLRTQWFCTLSCFQGHRNQRQRGSYRFKLLTEYHRHRREGLDPKESNLPV